MKLKSIYFYAALTIISTNLLLAQSSNLFINEFLASNVSTNISPTYEEYTDWIEIFNGNDVPVDIGGYYITDNLIKTTKWQIPANTVILAKGYLLVWADDKNTELHTNFKLSKDGEAVGLFNSNGEVIDTITFGTQYDDISYGRFADSLSQWSYFKPPTPEAKNISSGEVSIVPGPSFSISGGLYSSAQSLILSTTSPAAEIRYTTDGTLPTDSSQLFSGAIAIDSTVAIRACAFEIGKKQSAVITNTFFINEEVHLPVISIVTDPANLFDDEIGIYVTGTNGTAGECDATIRNLNQDWERPVNIELYETNGKQGLNQGAGIKIFGGCSRTRYPEKSFALFARSEYGKGSFEYKLFPSKAISKFESFLLRSSADDQVYTMMRDALAQSVMADQMDADIQAYQPAVVYINGEYWGIHNIREKLNEHYLEENFGVNPDDVNILEKNAAIFTGTNAGYSDMVNYVNSKNMAVQSNYEYVKTLMDVNQYIDYMIGHIYLAERDWPGNNIKYWRANSGQYSKWRWLNYDLDQTFTMLWLEEDMMTKTTTTSGFSWPNPEWSTRLFRNLLKNTEFKNEFIQRYAFYENTTFNPARLIHFIDSLSAVIAPEIPRHITKWGGMKDPDFNESWPIKATFNSVEEWNGNVDTLRIFAERRPEFSRRHIINKFKLSGTSVIAIRSNSPGYGILKIVDRKIAENFYGTFYNGIPLKISAIPLQGKKFSKWEVEKSSTVGSIATYTTQDISITLTGNATATAYFEDDTSSTVHAAINEINYKSASDFDTDDWVEIYNYGNTLLNLSNWQIKDSGVNSEFTIPANVSLAPNCFLVLCKDSVLFFSKYPKVRNVVGNFGFGLSSNGESIILMDSSGNIVDEVTYGNQSPWPLETNGTGYTIELKNYAMDNSLGSSWASSSYLHGSPGNVNSIFTNVERSNEPLPGDFYLSQNYPNPFNPETVISWRIALSSNVTLKVYDVLGREVAVLVNEFKHPGKYYSQFSIMNYKLSSGVYFYTLHAGEYVCTKKMLLIK